jgi:hypothetical protein
MAYEPDEVTVEAAEQTARSWPSYVAKKRCQSFKTFQDMDDEGDPVMVSTVHWTPLDSDGNEVAGLPNTMDRFVAEEKLGETPIVVMSLVEP